MHRKLTLHIITARVVESFDDAVHFNIVGMAFACGVSPILEVAAVGPRLTAVDVRQMGHLMFHHAAAFDFSAFSDRVVAIGARHRSSVATHDGPTKFGTSARDVLATVFAAHFRVKKPEPIKARQRIRSDVNICIASSGEPLGIALDIPSNRRIVIAEVVVVLPGLGATSCATGRSDSVGGVRDPQ